MQDFVHQQYWALWARVWEDPYSFEGWQLVEDPVRVTFRSQVGGFRVKGFGVYIYIIFRV